MKLGSVCVWSFAAYLLSVSPSAAQDIVLHATDASEIKGHWTRVDSTTGASGKKLTSANGGWSTPDNPIASPTHYFEASFTAEAWRPYRVWLRLRATGDSKWNDAVWVQFTNSVDAGGSAQYRIGTGSAMLVNLETCSGCGVASWGWTNDAWWKSQDTQIEFSTSGTQTVRVQTREDGVEIDQIVLSPSTYLSSPPGSNRNDTRILPRAGGTSAPATSPGTSAKPIPGTIQAEDFDNGANGTAYKDHSAGNQGGKYRSTDVDIESTGDTGGGYNVGWVGSGEWLNFAVDVETAGTYTLTVRVANPASGGKLHVNFNGVNKTGTMTVPNTGGYQSYRDVSATVSLSAGAQTMRVVFDTLASNGSVGNLNWIRLTAGAPPPPPPPTNGRVRVLTWNVHFGKTAGNVLNLDAQANLLANSGADIIVLQEVSVQDGDQPNRFPELLRARTGQTWNRVWAPHDGYVSGEGTLILTRLPILSSSTKNAYGRGFARAQVSIGGVAVQIFSVHLEYYDTSRRTQQLTSFMSWAGGYSGPAIAGGDFNSWWGETWIARMETAYTDTWQDVTGSDQNGYTHNNIRFDYLFRALSNNWRLTPTACWVISTTTSDHRPVVADYTVR